MKIHRLAFQLKMNYCLKLNYLELILFSLVSIVNQKQ
jgi:hypothetical protein